jgi:hypothetical protein
VTDAPGLAVLALKEIVKLLDKLTAEQLTDLVEGRAVVEFRSPEQSVSSSRPRKAPPQKKPVDLDEVIREIQGMTEEDAVEDYLKQRDKQLTLDALKELAQRIGPPVSASGGTKAILRKNIAAGTAGLLNRPVSAFASAWQS